MKSDELWDAFVGRLANSGCCAEDIAACPSSVLQQVFADHGFAPLECAQLHTLWARRMAASGGSGSLAPPRGASQVTRQASSTSTLVASETPPAVGAPSTPPAAAAAPSPPSAVAASASAAPLSPAAVASASEVVRLESLSSALVEALLPVDPRSDEFRDVAVRAVAFARDASANSVGEVALRGSDAAWAARRPLSSSEVWHQRPSSSRDAHCHLPAATGATYFTPSPSHASSSSHASLSSSVPHVVRVFRIVSPEHDAAFGRERTRLHADGSCWAWWVLPCSGGGGLEAICRHGFAAAPLSAASLAGAEAPDPAEAACPNGWMFHATGASFAALHATRSVGHSFSGGGVPSAVRGFLLCEVAVGASRLASAAEMAARARWAPAQCASWLRTEGYDSVRMPMEALALPPYGRNAALHAQESAALVVFDPRQAVPRYFVEMEVAAAPPFAAVFASSGGSDGASAALPATRVPTPTRTMSPASPASAPPANHHSGSVFCAVHPTKAAEFWSLRDRRLLCSHCMFVDGHALKSGPGGAGCVLAEEGAAAERAPLARWASAADGFARDVGSVVAAFESALERCRSDAAAALTGWAVGADRVRAHLAETEARLAAAVAAHSDAQQRALQRALMDTVALVSDVETVAEAAHAALRGEGGPLALLAARQAACRVWPRVDVPAYVAPAATIDVAALLRAIDGAVAFSAAGPAVPHLAAPTPAGAASAILELPAYIDANNLHADADLLA